MRSASRGRHRPNLSNLPALWPTLAPEATRSSHDAPNFIRVYKSGRVERFLRIDYTPPSTDAATGVSSRKSSSSQQRACPARIYLPTPPSGGYLRRLPVIVFFHGGGFCLGSSFDAATHGHANQLAARASTIVVSVEYRLAPEHPVPALYGDAWRLSSG
ncbi:hypothetical protein GUJ93_ZPchr0009g1344 [Zizania palustris]|uniref:Alpha/beta hydrolase fold-3 domain-containing protein n=1 Tax=Zizania palustris TaxID=103762 RepID=A0A8J5UYB7_ZIZPA|nr:hypothetical protein GUJ93_ZPchr0009g1344 [Zizania palustris]